MVNSETGELRIMERRQARIARMRKRLSRWGDVAAELVRSGQAELKQVTFTYRPGRGWRAGDIRQAMIELRRRLGKRLYGVMWVAELQADRPSREAVHYLAYLLLAPRTYVPTPDQSGIWIHGMTKLEVNRRGIGYAMKYAQKVEQKGGDFPRGLRLFAVTFYAHAPIPLMNRRLFRLSAFPRYAEDAFLLARLPEEPLPKRAEGGGYSFKGQTVRSPWRVTVRRAGWSL